MDGLFETLPQLAFCFDWNVSVEADGLWLDVAIERGSGIAACVGALRALASQGLVLALAAIGLLVLAAIRRRVR